MCKLEPYLTSVFVFQGKPYCTVIDPTYQGRLRAAGTRNSRGTVVGCWKGEDDVGAWDQGTDVTAQEWDEQKRISDCIGQLLFIVCCPDCVLQPMFVGCESYSDEISKVTCFLRWNSLLAVTHSQQIWHVLAYLKYTVVLAIFFAFWVTMERTTSATRGEILEWQVCQMNW